MRDEHERRKCGGSEGEVKREERDGVEEREKWRINFYHGRERRK